MNRMARLNRWSKFLSNFLRVTLHRLDQLYVFRMLVGGIWIRVNGTWSEVFVSQVLADESRILRMTSYDGAVSRTFHETHMKIQEIQEF